MKDDGRARKLFKSIISRWPCTLSAATSAWMIAELVPKQASPWRRRQREILRDVADHPVDGLDDDLEALHRLVKEWWEPFNVFRRNAAKALPVAQELLVRARQRGRKRFITRAETAIEAITTNRSQYDVRELQRHGLPRGVRARDLA